MHMTHNQKSQTIGSNLRDISYGLIMHRKIRQRDGEPNVELPTVDMQSFKGESRAIQEKSRRIAMQQREMEKMLESIDWKKKEEQWNYEYIETEYMRAVDNGTLTFDDKFELFCNPDGSRTEAKRQSVVSGVTWEASQKRTSEWLPREEPASSSNGWIDYGNKNNDWKNLNGNNTAPQGMPRPSLPTIEEAQKNVVIVGDGKDRESVVPMEIDNTPKRSREDEEGEQPKRTRSEEVNRKQDDDKNGDKTAKSDGKKDDNKPWFFPVPREELEKLEKKDDEGNP